MTLTRLTLPWGSEIYKLACPRCGTPVNIESEDHCSHLLFTYLDELGEFVFAQNAVKETASYLLDEGDFIEAISMSFEHALVIEFPATFTGPGMSVGWDYSSDDDF